MVDLSIMLFEEDTEKKFDEKFKILEKDLYNKMINMQHISIFNITYL